MNGRFFKKKERKLPQCVRCKSKRTIAGRVLGQLDAGGAFAFRPKGLKPIRLPGADVRLPREMLACCDCGLIWVEVNPSRIQRVVSTKGKKALKSRLGL